MENALLRFGLAPLRHAGTTPSSMKKKEFRPTDVATDEDRDTIRHCEAVEYSLAECIIFFFLALNKTLPFLFFGKALWL